MKRIVFLVVLIFFLNVSWAQGENPNQIQELLKLPMPPTPNAAALGKFGDIPVGLSTGIPSISIPLYEYESSFNKLNMHLSLDYHAGGHKVEDMASNCGLGWALNAGGVISRTLRGLPDDSYYGYLNTPPLPYYYTESTVDNFQYWSVLNGISTNKGLTLENNPYDFYRIKSIQERMLDGEADIFNFNAGGLSGKFFFKKNGEIQLITQSNVSVIPDFISNNGIRTIKSFTVIDKNTNIRYVFDLEETSYPSVQNINTIYGLEPNSQIPVYVSNWFLTKILSADSAETIKLEYDQIYSNLSYETGFSQSQSFDVTNIIMVAGPLVRSYTLLNTPYQIQLKTINFPDSTKVNFKYTFPRADYVGDYALTSIEIKNGNLKKIFNLAYDYFVSDPDNAPSTSNNDYLKRLKLVSVQQTDGINVLNPYQFEYNAEKLPPRSSTAQDFWGYYKGGSGGASLIQQIKIPDFYNTNYIGGADRNSSANYGKACILEKIIYPTGGHTKLFYSVNDAFTENYRIDKKIDSTTFSASQTNQFLPLNFVNLNNQVVNFKIQFYADFSSPPDGNQVPMGCTFYITIESTDATFTQTIIVNSDQINGGPYTIDVSLPLGKQYHAKYTNDCISLPPINQLSITYDYDIVPINKPIGGLRVSKTEDYDGIRNEPIITNYTYTGTDGMSSAEFQNIPNYDYYKTSLKHWNMGGGLPYFEWKYFFHINSSPNQSLSYFRGSPVIYKRVKVDKTINNKSIGYSIHEFTGFASTVVYTNNYPFVQAQDMEWRQALPLKESSYNSSNEIVKTVENEYQFLDGNELNSDNINLVTGVLIDDDQNTIQEIVFGVRAYNLITGRAELKRTKTRIYKDDAFIETKFDYSYNSNNFLVNNIKTKNSYGENVETRFYYPGNYTNTGLPFNVAGYNGDAEIVSKETWVQKGNFWYLTNALVNSYNIFQSIVRKNKTAVSELTSPLSELEVGIFNPDNLLRHTSFKEETEILKYDNKGRFTEIKSRNKPVSSFIWAANNHNSPIAIVENSSSDYIAATSFEPDAPGNWTINSKVRNSTALTGTHSYDLSNGNINATINQNNIYIVSYWTKSPSNIKVNGVQGSGGIQRNGWQYYEKEMTGVNNIILSGSGLIDELRLYPKGAQMTTNTFNPLVGVISQCDANNRLIYYEYDGFNRLNLIRDQDNNILKKICYNYSGQPEQCATNIPVIFSNDLMSQNFTRNNCGSGNTGSLVTYTVAESVYTSLISKEFANQLAQNDINSNGQAYANTNGTCIVIVCHPGNCIGQDKRCVNGNCETGIRINTASDYNPTTGRWDCTYHYEWSDGAWSSNFIEDSSYECMIF